MNVEAHFGPTKLKASNRRGTLLLHEGFWWFLKYFVNISKFPSNKVPSYYKSLLLPTLNALCFLHWFWSRLIAGPRLLSGLLLSRAWIPGSDWLHHDAHYHIQIRQNQSGSCACFLAREAGMQGEYSAHTLCGKESGKCDPTFFFFFPKPRFS